MSLLEVEDLTVEFDTGAGPTAGIANVSMDIARGETVGLVGESGSGKSVLCSALMGMVKHPGAVTGGRVSLDGTSLFDTDSENLRQIRGRRIALIPQDAAGALTPVRRIGDLMMETMAAHLDISRAAARSRAIEYLGRVGIPAPAERLSAHPFELSGGMKQRLAIALGLCCEPDVLIADDPTSAVDVTIQAQILKLLRDLASENGLAILLVSHDPRVIATMCKRVIVLYGGRVVETGPVAEVLEHPRHPYTRALLECAPTVDEVRVPLATVSGSPPQPGEQIPGCAFHPRCSSRIDRCETEEPLLISTDRRAVACWRPN